MAKGRSSTKTRGVYEFPPGSGIYWICYFDHLHKRHREKAGTKSAAILLYQHRKADALLRRKLPELARKAVTFSELASDALEYSRVHKRSHPTDRIRMKRIVGWFGERSAGQITPQDIERKLAELGPATSNRYKALISLCYRLAIQNGKAESNPARLIRRRPEHNSRLRYLTEEEEARLREQIELFYPQFLPHFDFALNTGLRYGDMHALKWEHVDLEHRILRLQRSKHGKPHAVPLNESAVDALQEIQGRNGMTIFGKPLDVRTWFDHATEAAGIKDFTWHDLRHTFASRLVMAGVDIRTVQELMGHTSIVTTMRYAHLSPEHQAEAVAKLVRRVNLEQRLTATKTAIKEKKAS